MRVNRFTTVIACSVGVAVIALPVLASGPDGTWSDLSLPGTLYRPSAIYDPVRERMVVVATSIPGSVWGLSTSQAPSWEAISTGGLPTQQGARWSTIPPANACYSSAATVADPATRTLPISNHTWQLPLSGPAIWTPVDDGIGPLPPPRMYHAAIYDAVHDRMMVFSGVGGGSGIASFKNDVWALSLSPTIVWQRIGGDLPCGAREWASAIDDPVRDRMIIYGGYGFGDRSLAWALSLGDPMNWIPLGASGPIPATRDQHAAVYDPVGDRMLLFGGRAVGTHELVPQRRVGALAGQLSRLGRACAGRDALDQAGRKRLRRGCDARPVDHLRWIRRIESLRFVDARALRGPPVERDPQAGIALGSHCRRRSPSAPDADLWWHGAGEPERCVVLFARRTRGVGAAGPRGGVAESAHGSRRGLRSIARSDVGLRWQRRGVPGGPLVVLGSRWCADVAASRARGNRSERSRRAQHGVRLST